MPASDIRELHEGETDLAHAAMAELRPAYEETHLFVEYVDGSLRPGGYELVGLFVPGRKEAAAVAGFRLGRSLAWGRYLYVEDLTTLAAERRNGYGRSLLDWLLRRAEGLGCDQMHLDSGVGPQRSDAHRLYLNAGFIIGSHHFVRDLPGTSRQGG